MRKNLNLILKFAFAKPHKGKFIMLLSSVIGMIFISSTFPFLFGRMIDEVFYEKSMDKFLSIVLIYCAIFLLNELLHFAQAMLWVNLFAKFLYDIRRAIFNKVLSMKGKELSHIYSGDIINRMGPDTDEIMNFIHWNVFYTIGGFLQLIVSLAFIYYLNWKFAVIVIILTPISVYISKYFANIVKAVNEDMKKEKGLLSSWYFEILKGLQDIKLLCAARNVLQSLTGRMVKITRLQIKATKVEVVSERVNSGISLITQMIIFTASAIFIINGEFTIGGFTAVISYFATCVLVFNLLNQKINGIARNTVAINRVAEILNKESENYNDDKNPYEIKQGNITFKDVYFSYNSGVDILSGINLEIKAGNVVSIVGYSGSGKTTLVNLMYKLYETEHGSITIDEKDINEFNLHNLRSQIGIVHQDAFIYDATFRYNLIFSNIKDSDDKIIEALKRAHLYKHFLSLPDGLDTIMGLNKNAMSGGQMQRLSIARIYIKNPKILIFDEATSSLDYESEMIVKESWKDLCEGRTILVIAHRLSTIINSDKIAVIVDGKIQGYDNHKTLIKNNHEYIKLFEEQYFSKGEVLHED